MMVKGIYVHIPFCSHKCPYCDFTSLTSSPVSPEEYVSLLRREMEIYGGVESRIKTLYFGGGTPTLFDPHLLRRIAEDLDRFFDLSELGEFSVECNPSTYGLSEFRELVSLGVNRLSIGAQTFSEKGLKVLGRDHSPREVLEAYQNAREAGFESVSLDLIYAYPYQTLEDLERDLEILGDLAPDHVSAYMLTPYKNTPLGVDVSEGKLSLPQEETISRMYEALTEGLRSMGYLRYEISNWSKEGKECKHNLLYWTMEEFLGLGVSAWGFVNGVRYGNTKNILSYRKKLLEGDPPIESRNHLSDRELFEEAIMLRLRLRNGLPSRWAELIPEKLKGFFEFSQGGVGIKEEFMILYNEIVSELMVDLDRVRDDELSTFLPEVLPEPFPS